MSNRPSEKRIPSERTLFERWLRGYEGLDAEDLRDNRTEFGYDNPEWDTAFAAWKARGDRRQLCRRTI
jgi:hypothetical protein